MYFQSKIKPKMLHIITSFLNQLQTQIKPAVNPTLLPATPYWQPLMLLIILLNACSSTVPNQLENRLKATEIEINATQAVLKEYYGGDEVLQNTWYMNKQDPAAKMGQAYLANKMARALIWQTPFVIGTLGSSVTAGTANCRYDSYQEQLSRTMSAIWQTAGVSFEVRNAGQGGECGDSHRNQIWCARTLVGDDVDIIHYSWTYFEAGDQKNTPKYHEMFYRWSLLLPHAPSPQLLYTNDCSKLSLADQNLLSEYGQFGANALCMQRGITKAGYKKGKWGEIGDSLHTTTRYGEMLPDSDKRKDSLGVVFRDWHPGPLLFQTTADALAYQYSEALRMAIKMIREEAQPKKRWPKKNIALAASRLPSPIYCNEKWCGSAQAPSCLSYEIPQHGISKILTLNPTDKASPFRRLAKAEDANWKKWDNGPNKKIPKAEKKRPECQLLNRCAGLKPSTIAKPKILTYKLPKQEKGFIAVCCAGKKCSENFLAAKPKFYLDDQVFENDLESIWKGKCIQVKENFLPGETSARFLGIDLPGATPDTPAITHIIAH